MSEYRKKQILERLKDEKGAVTGAELAIMLEVSRQVIVQDIAILRAEGNLITATSNGYIIPLQHNRTQLIKTIISDHQGIERMEEELSVIVEYGGRIIDVIVEHPVYGEIMCALMITTNDDVKKFIDKVKTSNAKPLSSLTDGEHIHTIEVPSEKIYNLIVEDLKERGFVKS